jgi:polysaccharide biosynthesis/export protein
VANLLLKIRALLQNAVIGEKVMKKTWLLTLCVVSVLMFAQAICVAQSQPANDAAVANAAPATNQTAPAPTSASASAPQFATRDPRYKIAASDTFDLTFPLSPEYNQLGVAVQPDGFVTLYSVGDIKVQGLSIPELTEAVRVAYGKILHDPIVSIVLKDFNKPYFIADGQIGHPGKYDLRAETTLSQAIAIAGGFTDDAKHSQVVLFRRVSDQWVSTQVIDVKKMESDKTLKEDPYLHPGDTVFVPKNKISKIKPWLPSYNTGFYIPVK